jgi:CRP-like cAMP-binding protein
MVSPELIRRFPFFSNLTIEQIVFLAKLAEEESVPRDHYFNNEGEELNTLYLILEGEIVLITTLPQKEQEVILNTLGPGDVFGWSSFIPPYTATAGAKAVSSARIVAFDAKELRNVFAEDYQFGYIMILKIAQVIRDRLNSLRIETLAYTSR